MHTGTGQRVLAGSLVKNWTIFGNKTTRTQIREKTLEFSSVVSRRTVLQMRNSQPEVDGGLKVLLQCKVRPPVRAFSVCNQWVTWCYRVVTLVSRWTQLVER